MLMSMTKEVVGSEPIDESDLSDADETTDDTLMMEHPLEHGKNYS